MTETMEKPLFRDAIPVRNGIRETLLGVMKTAMTVALFLLLPSCSGSAVSQLASGPRLLVPKAALLTERSPTARDGPARRLGAVPTSVEATLLPSMQASPANAEDRVRRRSDDDAMAEDGPLIDVVVDNTPAKAFFMGLAEGSEMNVVVHPKVQGNITLKLFHATIPQAIDTA